MYDFTKNEMKMIKDNLRAFIANFRQFHSVLSKTLHSLHDIFQVLSVNHLRLTLDQPPINLLRFHLRYI